MGLSMIPRVEEEIDDFGLIERRARLSRLGCCVGFGALLGGGAVDDDAGGFVGGEQVDGDVFGGQVARGLGADTGRCAAIGGKADEGLFGIVLVAGVGFRFRQGKCSGLSDRVRIPRRRSSIRVRG